MWKNLWKQIPPTSCHSKVVARGASPRRVVSFLFGSVPGGSGAGWCRVLGERVWPPLRAPPARSSGPGPV